MAAPSRRSTNDQPITQARFEGYFHHPKSPHSHIAHFILPSPARDRHGRMHTSVYTVEFFPPDNYVATSHFPLFTEVWGNVDDAMQAVSTLYSDADITKLASLIPSMRAEQLLPHSKAYMASGAYQDKPRQSSPLPPRRRRTPMTSSAKPQFEAAFMVNDVVCADTSAGYFIGRVTQVLGQHQGTTYYMLQDMNGNDLGTAAETTLRPVARDALGQNTCLPYDLERRKR